MAARTTLAMAALVHVFVGVAPARAQNHAHQADSLWSLGEFDAAARMYAARLAADSMDAVALLRLAVHAARRQRWTESLARYDQLLRIAPLDSDARAGRARVLAWSGRLDLAIRSVDSLLARSPRDLTGLQVRAQLTAWDARLVLSERYWRQALEIDPSNDETRVGLARTLRWQGRDAAARAVLAPVSAGNTEARAEREWIARAVQPRGLARFVHEDDSDGNVMTTFASGGGVRVASHIELRGQAYVRSTRLDSGAGLRGRAGGGAFGVWAQLEPGWVFQASAGASTSDARGAGAVPTWGAGLASPARYRVAGTLALGQSAFDYTALLVERRVVIRELAVEGRLTASRWWDLKAAFAAARFESGASGQSNRRWRANAEVARHIANPFALALAWRAFGFEQDRNDGYFDPDYYGVVEVAGRFRHNGSRWAADVEFSPGVQRIAGRAASGSFRSAGSISYIWRPGRQVSLSAVYARSGLQQLSPATAAGYRYAALGVDMTWRF